MKLFSHLQKRIKSTSEYFHLTTDELLRPSALPLADTLEEQLIMTDGSNYLFYDDLEDATYWKDEYKDSHIKAIVATINGRVAYILK